MLTELMFSLMIEPLNLLFSFLPTMEVAFLTPPASVTDWLGMRAAQINPLYPFEEVLAVVVPVLMVLPGAVVAYRTANWLYRHFPSIAGFGPGSG